MARNNLLAGSHPDIVDANVNTLKSAGYSHQQALHVALKHSSKTMKKRLPNIAKEVLRKAEGKVRLKQPRLTPSLPKIGRITGGGAPKPPSI